jgi:hypothetical protein
MRRVHFSIAGLMAVMVPIALGLAALHEATQVWVNIVFKLVVAALLTATYQAKRHKGFAGVWWAGFASFGWAHLVLGLIGMPWGQHYGISPDLVTQEVTGRLARTGRGRAISCSPLAQHLLQYLRVNSRLRDCSGVSGRRTEWGQHSQWLEGKTHSRSTKVPPYHRRKIEGFLDPRRRNA